jgi:hypothetical protein
VRTAWRIIKDWVQAQLALVEINMVTVPQVFLPYAIMQDGRTLWERRRLIRSSCSETAAGSSDGD